MEDDTNKVNPKYRPDWLTSRIYYHYLEVTWEACKTYPPEFPCYYSLHPLTHYDTLGLFYYTDIQNTVDVYVEEDTVVVAPIGRGDLNDTLRFYIVNYDTLIQTDNEALWLNISISEYFPDFDE